MTYAVAYTVTHSGGTENIVLSGLATREDVTDALTYSYAFGPISNVTISTY